MADRRAGTTRSVDPAREAAYAVIRAVHAEDAYTNLALPIALKRHGLSGRDAAFATELAAGTIRRRGTYDAVLAACLDRPLAKVDPPVLDALRLGAHQLLSMRVPAHAAVGTTVDLVRAHVHRGAAGFANAVLRKVGARDLDAWIAEVAPDPVTDPIGHAVVAHAHPRWVVDQLAASLRHHGREGELGALLAADNDPAKVTLVARPGLCEVAELERAGATPTGRSPYAAILAAGDPGALPAIRQGRAGVQDEGSQLVTLALAEAEVEGSDTRWLDMCAGPGGKAALLGALAGQRGAHLVANELQEHRATLVRKAVARLDDGVVTVTTGDATTPSWEPGSFDRVLLDAPCTGLGALRRRAEARWRRTPADLQDLQALQARLLDVAVASVRPGGVVGYVTCSPVLAETVEVVDAALARHDDLRLERAQQLWPHVDGTDAMYLALLRRR